MAATAQSQDVQSPGHFPFMPHASTWITLYQADSLFYWSFTCVSQQIDLNWTSLVMQRLSLFISKKKKKKKGSLSLLDSLPVLHIMKGKKNFYNSNLKTVYSLVFHSVLKHSTGKESSAMHEFSSWWVHTNMTMEKHPDMETLCFFIVFSGISDHECLTLLLWVYGEAAIMMGVCDKAKQNHSYHH